MSHPMPPAQGQPLATNPADDALFSKISWKLMPLLILCYIVAFIDRINIGFAQLQMKQTLSFSAEAYALGAGIFFLGYFLFEVPSNLILEKIGARKTLLRIMFCWGIVASCMMFVKGTTEFYILRFFLGAFEAGFFPGIILYLTYWYPSLRRGRVISVFMTATAVGYLIAGPLSGAIMKYMDGLGGHYGWQWLFVVQGMPATLLGIAAFFVLKDKPEDANWLSTAEKTRLRTILDADAGNAQASHGSLAGLFKDPKVMVMSFVYFLTLGANYTLVFLMPSLIKSWGVNDVFMVGILSSGPAIVGAIGMVVMGRSSDKRKERRGHFLLCQILAAGGLLMSTWATGNLALAMVGLAIMAIGQSANSPIFFTAVSEFLPRASAAAGIALVSCLGNLGPSATPWVLAKVTAATGSQTSSMYLVAGMWIVSALILMAVIRPVARGAQAQAAAA